MRNDYRRIFKKSSSTWALQLPECSCGRLDTRLLRTVKRKSGWEPTISLTCLGFFTLTSQNIGIVPGRFFNGRFLYGMENARVLAERAQSGRVWDFQGNGVASIFLRTNPATIRTS